MKKILSLSVLMFSVSMFAGAFDGALDSSFGSGGLTASNIGAGTTDAQAHTLIRRHDGALVAGGSVVTGANSSDFALIIFDEDGNVTDSNQLDVGGVNHVDQINGLAVQPDNKVVAVGQTIDMMGTSTFIVVRYNTDAQLDPTFNPAGIGSGQAGVVVVDFFGVTQAQAKAVAFKRDGRIVVVGSAQDANLTPGDMNPFYAIAVLNQDGSLDNTFASGAGRAVYSITDIPGNTASIANAVAIQSVGANDNIVLAGEANDVLFQLARITCDGNLDLTFANNGTENIDFGGSDGDLANGVDVYPDGRIVAVGTAVNVGGETVIAVTRRLVNGGADTSFNMGGATPGQDIFEIMGDRLFGNAVNVQNDGKILIAGQQAVTGPEDYFILVRYTSGGALDTTFGGNPGPGYVTTDFGGMPPNNLARAIALQQDGKIVVAGSVVLDGAMQIDFGLARYLNENDADEVFVEPTIEMPQSLSNCDINPPILSGAAQNPSNITVYVNGVEDGRTITTGSENAWTFTPGAPLVDGPNTFQIVAEYKSGNMNACSDPACCGIGLGPQSCISEAIREKYCPSCIDFPICG